MRMLIKASFFIRDGSWLIVMFLLKFADILRERVDYMANNISSSYMINTKQLDKKHLYSNKQAVSSNVKNTTETNRTGIENDNITISNYAVQMNNYTQLLNQAKTNGTGNGNPEATGSPIQILNAKVFNVSMAYGELAGQSGTNAAALNEAFRDTILSLFDEAALAVHKDTGDTYIHEQARADARSLGEAYLHRFFNELKKITPQNLKDTGMVRQELAFHQAMNFIYFEVGMSVLGGSVVAPSDSQQTGIYVSDEEFRRQMMEALLSAARDNAEIYKQWAEMRAEEAERFRKIMLIAARIAAGDNVPQADKDYLMENSPGMYALAMASRVERENPRDYESLVDEDKKTGIQFATVGDEVVSED
jgi:hypothetical protein